MVFCLQPHIFLHTDGPPCWGDRFAWSVFSSMNPFRKGNKCTFGTCYSTGGPYNYQMKWYNGRSSFTETMAQIHFSRGSLDFVVSENQTALCCGALLLQKHIFMPRPNDIYRLCFVSPPTAVNYSFSTPEVPQSERWKGQVLFTCWVERGPPSCLLWWDFRSWDIIECRKVLNFT